MGNEPAGKLDVHDGRSEVRQGRKRRVVGCKDVAVYPFALVLRHPGQSHAGDAAVETGARIVRGHVQCGGVVRIRTLKKQIQADRILDRSAHRPRRIERVGQRQDAMTAHPPEGDLESRESVPRAGESNRASGIGPDGPWGETGGDADARPGAAPSRCAMDGEVPRIPWRSHVLIGPPGAHRELDRARLADDDDPGLHEPAGQRRGHRRDARFPDLRAAGRDPPFEVDDVLERDRVRRGTALPTSRRAGQDRPPWPRPALRPRTPRRRRRAEVRAVRFGPAASRRVARTSAHPLPARPPQRLRSGIRSQTCRSSPVRCASIPLYTRTSVHPHLCAPARRS